jgi:hypothetical protein
MRETQFVVPKPNDDVHNPSEAYVNDALLLKTTIVLYTIENILSPSVD